MDPPQKKQMHIPRFSKNAAKYKDTQDFMAPINHIMQLKEELQNEIRNKATEINTYVQILETSSVDEIKELFESIPKKSEYTPEETKLVQEYHTASKELNVLRLLSHCYAMSNDDGDIILRFAPKLAENPVRFLLWLTMNDDAEYRVKSHDFPSTIPIDKLEEKYLKDKAGTDEILKRFTTAIYQYTWPFFHRIGQIISVEKSETGKIVSIYRNEDITLISFLLDIGEDEERKFSFEFVLKYHPEDILPHHVKAVEMRGREHPQTTQNTIESLLFELHSKPLIEGLNEFYRKMKATAPSFLVSESSSASSASTTLFEML